jgi:hypothetical protein
MYPRHDNSYVWLHLSCRVIKGGDDMTAKGEKGEKVIHVEGEQKSVAKLHASHYRNIHRARKKTLRARPQHIMQTTRLITTRARKAWHVFV